MTTEIEEGFNVYALISKNSKNQKDGYLLFMNEEKANAFLEISKSKPAKTHFVVTQGEYEKHGSVEVNKFLYEKIKTNFNFFVRELDTFASKAKIKP